MKIENVIVALDLKGKKEFEEFVAKFPNPIWFKVGMELIYDQGFGVVKYLKDKGHKVFLDLKLLDIPNTVKKSIESISKYNVDMTTVHTLGGLKMLKAANQNINILGVTILTSINQETLNKEMNIELSIEQQVINLAKLAKKANLFGVVCSPHEAKLIKDLKLNIVTPGIRREKDANNDQKRIATPQQAKANGATYIIIGRPITQAQDPYREYLDFVKEFNNE